MSKGFFMKYIIVFLSLLLIVACSQTETQTVTKTSDVQAEPEKQVYNGIYIFDIETYKKEQLMHQDSIFKDKEPKEIDKMMKIFRPFRIEINNDMATASFSNNVIQGKIKKLSQSGQKTSFLMTPIDQSKKDQQVTLILDDDRLVLDPGKKETDKMYFKRRK